VVGRPPAPLRVRLIQGPKYWCGNQRYRSALTGSVEVNNPAITRVLLEAGANPDDGQCIGEGAGYRDHRCLELLISHGAGVAGTWALGAAVYADDPQAVSLLLDAIGSAGGDTASQASRTLADAAAADASYEVIAVLLAAGADPDTTDSDVGFSALRRAVRAGQAATAALLVSGGATNDSTDVDRFIGACRAADRAAARQLVAEHPDIPARLTDDDRATFVGAAGSAPRAVIALMLELGFSPEDRNGLGEQPLHTAAYLGNAEAVRLLIDAGADVDARDTRFDATPLAYATVGSGEHPGHPGNWAETVRLLIAAGASRESVWISGKPPSEEVIGLLRSYGITPDDESWPAGGDDADDAPRWLCNTSAQVLDWYRQSLADGTRPTVESVEVDRDAVVLGITLARPAEQARPAPAERLYQVFTVANGEVIEIQGPHARPRIRWAGPAAARYVARGSATIVRDGED
jgi:ankyrin repeat protein